MIVEILDKHRQDIPDFVDMNPFIKYPLSMSLSFPNVPHLFPDRVEIPFDGTIYLTSDGYHPFEDPAPPMPTFNPSNPNNIQFFVNQHVVKTTVVAARKAGLSYEINSDTLKPFGLADDLMKVEYLSMLFPRLACHFDSSQTVRIQLTVDNSLNTDINFAPDKVHGEFSPNLKFLVGDQHAFTLSLRAIFDATTTFEMRDKQSFAKGNLDNVDLADIRFGAGAVEEIDLADTYKRAQFLL